MTIAGSPLGHDERSELREAVLYRTRLTGADGSERPATLVNVSPGGFMARCDEDYPAGTCVTAMLPRIGRVAAEVRWALGGRIGCQWHKPLGMGDYHALLQALPKE
jgi:hypothetical protein